MTFSTAEAPLMTKEIAAIKFNVSVSTVNGWLNDGKIIGVPVGRRVLIPTNAQKPTRKPYEHTGRYKKTFNGEKPPRKKYTFSGKYCKSPTLQAGTHE